MFRKYSIKIEYNIFYYKKRTNKINLKYKINNLIFFISILSKVLFSNKYSRINYLLFYILIKKLYNITNKHIFIL